MPRFTLLACSALLIATGACAGFQTGRGAPHERAVRHALVTSRYGEPSVLWFSGSKVRIEYDTHQYESAVDAKSSPDSAGAHYYRAFDSLARSIARTAVTGYGTTPPQVVEVVLHERRSGGVHALTYGGADANDHEYVFRGAELASR